MKWGLPKKINKTPNLCSPDEIICKLRPQKDGGRCKSEDLDWRTEDRSLQAIDVQDSFKPALDWNCKSMGKKKTWRRIPKYRKKWEEEGDSWGERNTQRAPREMTVMPSRRSQEKARTQRERSWMGDENEAKFWPLTQVGIIPEWFPWRQRILDGSGEMGREKMNAGEVHR